MSSSSINNKPLSPITNNKFGTSDTKTQHTSSISNINDGSKPVTPTAAAAAANNNNNNPKNAPAPKQQPTRNLNFSFPIYQKGHSATVELTEDQERDIHDAFNLFDSDKSGTITAKEWKIAMKAIGFAPSKEELKKMMDAMDADGSGTIEYQEFLNLIRKKMLEKKIKDEMKHAFYLFDSDNKGFLNLDDLKKLMHPGNGADDPDQLTKEDVLEMMEEGDKDGDGKITLDDFLRIMKKTRIWFRE